MSHRRPLDPAFPIERQIDLEAAPIVLVNVFTLDEADELKRQPGFISTQLHRAIGESPTYLNYAVWESTADSGPRSRIRSSSQSSRPIHPRRSPCRISSRRSRCRASASPRRKDEKQ